MNACPTQPAPWQIALSQAVTDPAGLLTLLELDPGLLPAAMRAAKLFPLRVPRNFVARMQKGNPDDPLLRQVLPLDAETLDVPGFTTDPLTESNFTPVPGLLHKYHGRVLLTITGACAIHCRYCFRRSFPYAENIPNQHGRQKILDYLGTHPEITEVILSGGDPLAASDTTLATLVSQLAAIPHIKRLRIHSRLPVVLPERITPSFISATTATRLPTVLVLHCNHANELSPELKQAITALRTHGITVLNQTVLLRGVNDCADTLITLSETLFDTGILPYYLHVLDRVAGAAHFAIPEATAITLHQQMRCALPGYLVPLLVREISGAQAKTPLGL